MKPNDFAYIKAESLDHALGMLSDKPDDAKLIAGGQSLVATLNMRLSTPELLIDIGGLEELRGIALDGDSVRIGAGTRHVELERSPLIAAHVPLITLAIKHVAHAAVRNRGTIGGNLALADPASELPACCVALDAQFELSSLGGVRRVAAREFFIDLFETALRHDEILSAVLMPKAKPQGRCAFREFVRRKGDFALAGLAVCSEMDKGRIKTLAPVFFGVSNTPVMATQSAALITNREFSDANVEAAMAALAGDIEVFGSIQASEAYKRHLMRHYFVEVLREMYDSPGP